MSSPIENRANEAQQAFDLHKRTVEVEMAQVREALDKEMDRCKKLSDEQYAPTREKILTPEEQRSYQEQIKALKEQVEQLTASNNNKSDHLLEVANHNRDFIQQSNDKAIEKWAYDREDMMDRIKSLEQANKGLREDLAFANKERDKELASKKLADKVIAKNEAYIKKLEYDAKAFEIADFNRKDTIDELKKRVDHWKKQYDDAVKTIQQLNKPKKEED
jgi:chromosome segregation ATPase